MISNMLDRFSNSVLDLVKSSGQRYEGIKATVSTEHIVISNALIPIEEGDLLERKLPTGDVEQFRILDRGFKDAFHQFPAHYQVKYERVTNIRSTGSSNQTIQVHGANSRVNIGSQDHSINITSQSTDDTIDTVKKAILRDIQQSEKRLELLEKLNELDKSRGTKTFSVKYGEFIQSAANHMTVIAPFLPALTELLKQAVR